LKISVADLYLFDGYNLLHAGPFADARELVDLLASYVAVRGARGVVVFDGVGEDVTRGPLEVRYAPHADTLLERLAAEHRDIDRVVLVTSDSTVGWASGIEVAKLSSQTFLRDFERGDVKSTEHRDERPEGLAGKLDQATRDLLEKLRRGE
jgi:predicted RNA-binding protein with PIN domain